MSPPDTLTSLIAETLSCIALMIVFYFALPDGTSMFLAFFIAIGIPTSVNILVHKTSEAALAAFNRAVDERICRDRDVHNIRLVQIERALRKHDEAQRDVVQEIVDAGIDAGLEAQQSSLQELVDTRSQQFHSTQKAALLDEIQRLNNAWEQFFEIHAAEQQDTLRRIVHDETKDMIEHQLAVSKEKLIPTIDARINEIQDDQQITQQQAFKKLIEDRIEEYRTHDLAAKQTTVRTDRKQLYNSLGKALGELRARLMLYVEDPDRCTHTHHIVPFIQAGLAAYGALETHAPSTNIKTLQDRNQALKEGLTLLAYGEYAAYTKGLLPSILDAVNGALDSGFEDEVLGGHVSLARPARMWMLPSVVN
ncbi:hypothetical protein LTR27_005938 [Elasticomyces elasticus]|nr:hypothetical protein LTR27_005938 [Elasticomyces elasticus]